MALRSYQYQVQAVVVGSSTIIKSVETELNLVSSAEDGINVSVESVLGLNSFSVGQALPGGTSQVDSVLNIQHTAHAFGFESLESELLIVSTVGVQGPVSIGPATIVSIASEATFLQEKNVSADTYLSIGSNAGRASEENLESALTIGSQACRIFAGETDLNLTSLSEWGYGYTPQTAVQIIDLAEADLDLNRGLSSEDIVYQSCSYFIESRCNRHRFNSFDGAGAVPGSSQKLNYDSTFLMLSLDDGNKVLLRNPETDDRRRYAFNRINRTFLDGTADIYADPSWVTEQTQIYTVIANKRDSLEEVFSFIQGNLGREVLIKDWRGVSWIVIITNPGELYTEDGEGYWTVNFEAVGEAIDGEFVKQHVQMSDELSRSGSIWVRPTNSANIVTDNVLLQPMVQSTLSISSTSTFTIV